MVKSRKSVQNKRRKSMKSKLMKLKKGGNLAKFLGMKQGGEEDERVVNKEPEKTEPVVNKEPVVKGPVENKPVEKTEETGVLDGLKNAIMGSKSEDNENPDTNIAVNADEEEPNQEIEPTTEKVPEEGENPQGTGGAKKKKKKASKKKTSKKKKASKKKTAKKKKGSKKK